jgi:signal transduction histidine kinase/ligand-binding sensor domain-containing protein
MRSNSLSPTSPTFHERLPFAGRALFVAVLLCLVHDSLYAQVDRVLGRYLARRWSEPQDISGGRIAGLAQTPDGYLWIGTETGLVRFDGLSFRPFAIPGIEERPRILDLTVDRDGLLWFRTEDARLFKYDGHTFSSVLSPEQGEAAVVALAPGMRHGLIFAGLTHGLSVLEGSSFRNLQSLEATRVVSIAQTDDGTLWLGMRYGGLYRSQGNAPPSSIASTFSGRVNCMLPAGGGQLWIGTDTGLANWDGHSAKSLQLFDGGAPIQVLAMVQDREGNLWAGTSEGLLRYTTAGTQWVRHNGVAVTALLRDREGDLWFGDGSVLERLRDTPLISYGPLSEGEGGKPGAVYADSSGKIWVAPLRGGLLWMRDGIVHPVDIAGIAKDVVYSIDGRGDEIWLGRQRGGLTRLQVQGETPTAKTWTEKEGLAQNSIYSVRVLEDGTVWACTLNRGVSRLESGRLTNYASSVVGSDTVLAIAQTTDRSVWFGTTKGLSVLKGNSWRQVTKTGELSVLLADAHNGLWVGGKDGLQYLDSQHVLHNTRGVAGAITGLAFGRPGILWIGTSEGVSSTSADPQETMRGRPLPLRGYGPSDGLLSTSVINRARSMVQGEHDRVWLATEAGLAAGTGYLENDSVPAKAHIEEIRADESPLNLDTNEVEVPPGSGRVTFRLTGIDLRAPEHVLLRFRLDRFDKDWSAPTANREATYTNVPSGHYVFHVIAQNSQGQWDDAGTTLRIKVLPTLLERWDSRTAIFLLLVISGVLVYRSRLRFVVHQTEMRAEERLSERTRIARELHDTLLQSIAGAVLHLQAIDEEIPGTSPAHKGLGRIMQRMEDVTEEARLVVQGLRQEEEGSRALRDSFSRFVEMSGANNYPPVNVTVIGEELTLRPAVHAEIVRLGREAVMNAMRHAEATRLDVTLTYSKAEFHLCIEDNGKGIEPSHLAEGRAGHFGLAGMRERARDLGAYYKIESIAGKGTSVELSMPAKLAYKAADPRIT